MSPSCFSDETNNGEEKQQKVEVSFLHGNSYVDNNAIKQLKQTARLPGMVKCVGMPDLHPGGKRYPVGAAFLSRIIYPELVGGDIGCGMSLWKLDLKADLSDHQLQILASKLSNLSKRGQDMVRKEAQEFTKNASSTFQSLLKKHDHELGSIGGGNHFAELQVVVSGAERFSKHTCYLLVHSGSRLLGNEVLDDFRNDKDVFAYKRKHDLAVKWARENREQIARYFVDHANCKKVEKVLDICHNCVVEKNGAYLHRKGAAPTDCGLVAIPGSRGTFTYIVEPVDDVSIQEACGWSVAHGAGRLLSRKDIQDQLVKKYACKGNGESELSRTAFGGYVVYEDLKILYQEAPEAYKDIDDIIVDLESTGVVRVVAKLKPLVTCKL